MTFSDRRAIEKVLGFALPADARLILVERSSGLDDMLRAKIELSASSFDALAQTLPMSLDAMTPGPGRLGSDKGLWNPRATPGIKAGQIARPGGRYLNIGVAADNGRVALFMMEHGT